MNKPNFECRLINLLQADFHYDNTAESHRKAYEKLIALISEAVNSYKPFVPEKIAKADRW